MVWDPTFDWADATSFNGEARKYDILAEMIVQVNIRCTSAGISTISTPIKGGLLALVQSIDSTIDSLLSIFYNHLDQINYKKWTVTDLNTEIGITKPSFQNGYVFSPLWITWVYEALNLLTWNGDCEVYIPAFTAIIYPRTGDWRTRCEICTGFEHSASIGGWYNLGPFTPSGSGYYGGEVIQSWPTDPYNPAIWVSAYINAGQAGAEVKASGGGGSSCSSATLGEWKGATAYTQPPGYTIYVDRYIYNPYNNPQPCEQAPLTQAALRRKY